MTGHRLSPNRRQVIQGVTGALTAGSVINLSETSTVLEKKEQDTEMPLGRAQPGGAQPNGGPMNQSYRDTPQSATGIKNVTKITDQPTSYAPITSPDGITASVQYFDGQDDGYITFFDIQNQEIINQIKTLPGLNPGAWVNGDYLAGNTTNAQLYGINGEVKQTFTDNSEGAIALQGEKAYLGTGEGVAEVSKDDITEYTTHELIAGPNPDSLTVIEEGDILAGYAYRNLFSHDTQKQKTIAEPSMPANPHVSADGEHLFTLAEEGLAAYKVPKSMNNDFEQVASSPLNGGPHSPPMISERNEETRIVAGTGSFGNGFTVQAYSLYNGTMREVWSQEVEGLDEEGVEEVVGLGDSVVASAKKLYGFNLHTGEQLFVEDIDGKVGMPHGRYIPVGTEEGTYVLEMETGGLEQEAVTPRPTSTPQSTPTATPTDTQTPTTTETPEPTPTEAESDTTASDTQTTREETPGLGLLAGLAGVAGGAAYAVRRYRD